MATGDRIKVITDTEFQPLEQQINDSTTGLAGRVDQLESNPEYTLVKPYLSTFNYPVGYPIFWGGRLAIAKVPTTGTFDSNAWEVLTRENSEPIEITDGTTTASFILIAGTLALLVDDGTTSRQFQYSVSTGRLVMSGAVPLESAGDKDGVIKEDLTAYAEKAYDSLSLPTAPRVALVDDTGKIDYLDDIDSDDLLKLTRLNWDDTAKRFTQVDTPLATADTDEHVLVKKDADSLYRAKADYPINEVFCLGVVKVDTSGDSSATAYGFKYATPSISGVEEKTSTTDMDYTKFDISEYKPTGSTLTALWLDISGEERDNKFAYQHTLNTAGSAGEIRVYSADNSDWGGDNVMGMDDAVMWVKIWAVASE